MKSSTFKSVLDGALGLCLQAAQGQTLSLQPSDPKVTKREQAQPRCGCRRSRRRPAMVSIFILPDLSQGTAQLLVDCNRCHAQWVWGAR